MGLMEDGYPDPDELDLTSEIPGTPLDDDDDRDVAPEGVAINEYTDATGYTERMTRLARIFV